MKGLIFLALFFFNLAASATPTDSSLAAPRAEKSDELSTDVSRGNLQPPVAQPPVAQLPLAESRNAVLWYNTALSEYQNQNKALAVALWRRAVQIDPWLWPARQALTWAYAQGMPQEPARGFDWWHQYVLGYVPTPILLAVWWVLLLMLCAWGWRTALKEHNQPLVTEPDTITQGATEQSAKGRRVAAYLWAMVFVFLGVLTAAKLYDLSLVRATVVGPGLDVQTAPQEGANVLFQARLGQPVVAQKIVGDWVLYAQNGRTLGWLARSSLKRH